MAGNEPLAPGGDASHPFGALLRAHRRAAGLTQAALGERAGMSARGIQNLERGLHRPYRASLERLARALGLAGAERARFEAAGAPAPRRRARRAAGPPASPPAARLAAARPHTALCAEIVDFAALAARLPAAALATVVAAWRAEVAAEVAHYGGTAAPLGPAGSLALFGVPHAQEDHAARALHAALGIQALSAAHGATVARRWRVPFQVRIGVASAIAPPPGAAAAVAVRAAAVLQQQAWPGTVLVSAPTRAAAGEAFAWRAQPSPHADAPPGCELLGLAPGPGRFAARRGRGLTPFVGRADALAALATAWAEARAGRGQLVTVAGEAGIGKSRLLHEFAARLAAEGVACRAGASLAYAATVSYLPFQTVLRSLVELAPTTPPASAEASVGQRLAALALDPAAFAPALLSLLGYAVADPAWTRLAPARVRERTVAALVAVLTAEAARAPYLLLLEDAHWLDAASAEVLAALVEALPAVPLLLVVTYRPEAVHAWAPSEDAGPSGAAVLRALGERPDARAVVLARLPPADATALARAALPAHPVAPDAVALLAARAEGHPLFTEELAHALLASGALVRRAGQLVLATPPPPLPLPDTLAGLLLARLDRLPDALQPVVRAAATIGRTFDSALLRAVLPPETPLERLLLQLADLDLVYPAALAPRRQHAFKHVLVQEAAYASLAPAERAALHGQVGAALEALHADRLGDEYERLAYHYGRSTQPAKALHYLVLAHAKAVRANAAAEAHAYFAEASALLDTLPPTPATLRQRVTLLAEHHGAVMELLASWGAYYAQLVRYAEHAEAVADAAVAGAYLEALALGHWAFGHLRDGITVGERGAALSLAAGRPERAGLASFAVQACHLALGEYDRARHLSARIGELLAPSGDLRHQVRALAVHAYADAFQGRWAAARATGARALALAQTAPVPPLPRSLGDRAHLLFWAHNALAMVLGLAGALEDALTHAAEAVAHARTQGDQVWAQATQGWLWCRAGDPARGLAQLAPAAAFYSGEALAAGTAMFQTLAGEGQWLAGDAAGARATLLDVLGRAERWGMPLEQGMAHRLLGEIALPTDAAQAAAHFERALALLAPIGAENELALAYAGYGRAQARLGATARARDYLGRARAIFTRLGTRGAPGPLGDALTARTS